MSTLCVVQARMGSTRLPGKVLADIGGRPMLALMLARLSSAPVDALVVATSSKAADDAIVPVAGEAGAEVVRGPEDDVLARFAIAMQTHPADTVVRLTADCPLADPAVVRQALERHEETGADYTSNTIERTFPDGVDTEVVRAAVLQEAAAEATDRYEREHVTPFVYQRPERFTLASFVSGDDLGDLRWTVDTAADLEKIRRMVDRLTDPVTAGWREILSVADEVA